MTPREVDELHPREYDALMRYALRVQTEERRAIAKARRKRG